MGSRGAEESKAFDWEAKGRFQFHEKNFERR